MHETQEQKFAKEELRRLLSDWDNGMQPSNIVLDELVRRELNKQYRQSMRETI